MHHSTFSTGDIAASCLPIACIICSKNTINFVYGDHSYSTTGRRYDVEELISMNDVAKYRGVRYHGNHTVYRPVARCCGQTFLGCLQ